MQIHWNQHNWRSHSHNSTAFLDSINRGGLMKPNDTTYGIVLRCWRLYKELRNTPELNSQLLSATNQRLLFEKIMERAYNEEMITVDDVVASRPFCTSGHDLQQLIVRRFFNCVAKNLAKELTNNVTTNAPHLSKKRKIEKLTSKSH